MNLHEYQAKQLFSEFDYFIVPITYKDMYKYNTSDEYMLYIAKFDINNKVNFRLMIDNESYQACVRL